MCVPPLTRLGPPKLGAPVQRASFPPCEPDTKKTAALVNINVALELTDAGSELAAFILSIVGAAVAAAFGSLIYHNQVSDGVAADTAVAKSVNVAELSVGLLHVCYACRPRASAIVALPDSFQAHMPSMVLAFRKARIHLRDEFTSSIRHPLMSRLSSPPPPDDLRMCVCFFAPSSSTFWLSPGRSLASPPRRTTAAKSLGGISATALTRRCRGCGSRCCAWSCWESSPG